MQDQNSQGKSPFNFTFPHQVYGSPEKPIIVFLHGYLGSNKDWKTTAELLADNFCCICFDLPGTNANKAIKQEEISFESISTALSADLTGISKPYYLTGYSMGARIAMYTVLNKDSNLQGLILESGSPGIKESEDRAERLKVDRVRAQKIRENGLESFLPKWYAAKLFASLAADPVRLENTIAQRLEDNTSQTAAAVIEQMSPGLMPFMGNRLQEISIPSLVICGELDEKYLKVCKSIDEALPNSQFSIVRDAGHNVHVEKPQEFADLVRNFIQGIESNET